MSYKTKQSENILRFLKENTDRHLTAEEIYSALRESGDTVGRTTVYRHLERLYADGIIRKFLTGDSSGACFQYIGNREKCQSHYHLRCTKCGKLIHTSCDYLNGLSRHVLSEHSFILDPEKTVIYGICSDCKENKK